MEHSELCSTKSSGTFLVVLKHFVNRLEHFSKTPQNVLNINKCSEQIIWEHFKKFKTFRIFLVIIQNIFSCSQTFFEMFTLWKCSQTSPVTF